MFFRRVFGERVYKIWPIRTKVQNPGSSIDIKSKSKPRTDFASFRQNPFRFHCLLVVRIELWGSQKTGFVWSTLKQGHCMTLSVMKIKRDTLAIPTQHTMSAKARVELIFPFPSLEKGRQNHFQLLQMGKWHVWPFWQGLPRRSTSLLS